jgi:general secretion pathway protein G
MEATMKKRSGFTLVELMVVLTVIALLLSVVVPDYIGRMKTAEEAVLRENLTLMREALDKHYADAGKYPGSLDDLVSKRYLRNIPPDPFTRSASTWVAVPPPGQRNEKGNVYDVKSSAKGYESW